MSKRHRGSKIVIDNIHGAIELTNDEWKVVNTASFQRLRRIKQLGMGHLVYPNATHTRFAHSLGVFAIMARILESLNLPDEEKLDLRLAALLHDIGHYPYSHLVEQIEKVRLTEEVITKQHPPSTAKKFPDHEELGRYILLTQNDICDAIGGKSRAERIGHLFSRTGNSKQQFSKLIHSSLDMDRMDYLVRDARAAGVPYGEIDIHYILKNIRFSSAGNVGVDIKALAAVEQFLMARLFMYRSIYYHKTTLGFEEACRNLLRRLRDKSDIYKLMPQNGHIIEEIASSEELFDFTDARIDHLIRQALDDDDEVIKTLAKCILSRRTPKLVGEVSVFESKAQMPSKCQMFAHLCESRVHQLAEKYDIEPGKFLLCHPKAIKFEDRGSLFNIEEMKAMPSEEKDELIKVFERGGEEPKPIVDIQNSLISHCASRTHAIYRIYLVDHSGESEKRASDIRNEIDSWIAEFHLK